MPQKWTERKPLLKDFSTSHIDLSWKNSGRVSCSLHIVLAACSLHIVLAACSLHIVLAACSLHRELTADIDIKLGASKPPCLNPQYRTLSFTGQMDASDPFILSLSPLRDRLHLRTKAKDMFSLKVFIKQKLRLNPKYTKKY